MGAGSAVSMGIVVSGLMSLPTCVLNKPILKQAPEKRGSSLLIFHLLCTFLSLLAPLRTENVNLPLWFCAVILFKKGKFLQSLMNIKV